MKTKYPNALTNEQVSALMDAEERRALDAMLADIELHPAMTSQTVVRRTEPFTQAELDAMFDEDERLQAEWDMANEGERFEVE